MDELSKGIVTLDGPAPASGVEIQLSTTKDVVSLTHPSVTINSAKNQAEFNIFAERVGNAKITATDPNGTTLTKTLSIVKK